MAPPALGMGLCFPVGLRLAERIQQGASPEPVHLGPWLWGVNGAFGVCASGLALGVSMTLGITVTLFAGAACYFLLLGCTFRLGRPRPG